MSGQFFYDEKVNCTPTIVTEEHGTARVNSIDKNGKCDLKLKIKNLDHGLFKMSFKIKNQHGPKSTNFKGSFKGRLGEIATIKIDQDSKYTFLVEGEGSL